MLPINVLLDAMVILSSDLLIKLRRELILVTIQIRVGTRWS
jgi:pilus assembly protein TadC